MGNTWVLWSLHGWPTLPSCLACVSFNQGRCVCSKTPHACWKRIGETNKYSEKLVILAASTLPGFRTWCVEKRASLGKLNFPLLPPWSVNFRIMGTTYSKSLGVENKCCSLNGLSLNDHTRAQCTLQASTGWFCSIKSNQIRARLQLVSAQRPAGA